MRAYASGPWRTAERGHRIHSVRNVGDGPAAELATYVLEKGKSFLVVVDE